MSDNKDYNVIHVICSDPEKYAKRLREKQLKKTTKKPFFERHSPIKVFLIALAIIVLSHLAEHFKVFG